MGQDIVKQARIEAERMKTSVSGVDGSKQVSMTVEKFAALADMIASLAEPADAEIANTWAADTLNDSRHWVPLPHFQRVKAEADHWHAEYNRIKEQQGYSASFPF